MHDVASFQPDPGMRMIEAFFREILRTWLSRENPKPSWDELTSALMDMKYVVLAANIMQMGRYIYLYMCNVVVLCELVACIIMS